MFFTLGNLYDYTGSSRRSRDILCFCISKYKFTITSTKVRAKIHLQKQFGTPVFVSSQSASSRIRMQQFTSCHEVFFQFENSLSAATIKVNQIASQPIAQAKTGSFNCSFA